MGLEEIKKSIETGDIAERVTVLEQRIFKVQLFMLEKLIKDPKNSNKSYVDLFEKNTSTIASLTSMYYVNKLIEIEKSNREEVEKLEIQFADGVKKDIRKISSETEGEERVNAVSDYVRRKFDEFPKVEEGDKDFVGLIYYNEKEAGQHSDKIGLEEKDRVFEIHFESLFTKENNLGFKELKEWFSKLAEIIVEKYPQVSAICGTSWLMSHPIMKRFGFSIVTADDRESRVGMSYWKQLINKDGQIDSDKLDFLFKNGELPYKVSTGYISIEDFLNLYLPDDKRGEIVLKKVDKEDLERKEKAKQQSREIISRDWGAMLKLEISADELFEKMPDFIFYIRSLDLENEIRAFFQECISKGIVWDKVRYDKDMFARFEPIFERIDKEIRTAKYIDYKVFIPKRNER